jgi:hypothetical protein
VKQALETSNTFSRVQPHTVVCSLWMDCAGTLGAFWKPKIGRTEQDRSSMEPRTTPRTTKYYWHMLENIASMTDCLRARFGQCSSSSSTLPTTMNTNESLPACYAGERMEAPNKECGCACSGTHLVGEGGQQHSICGVKRNHLACVQRGQSYVSLLEEILYL